MNFLNFVIADKVPYVSTCVVVRGVALYLLIVTGCDVTIRNTA